MTDILVGKEAVRRETLSTGFQHAFDAYREIGEQPDAVVNPRIRVGPSIAVELPKERDQLITRVYSAMDLAMEIDPRHLDEPPRLDTAFGVTPSGEAALEEHLARLYATPGSLARKRLALCLQHRHTLLTLRESWQQRCTGAWRSLLSVERRGNELFATHLLHNRWVARTQYDRYFGRWATGAPRPPLKESSPEVRALRAGYVKAATARKSVQLDQIGREKLVVDTLATIISVGAVLRSVERGELVPDRQAERELAIANGLRAQAAQNRLEAVTAYLRVVADVARAHPLLLALAPQQLSSTSTGPFTDAIVAAIRDAESAIEELLGAIATQQVLPATRTQHTVTPSGLAGLIAGSGRTSVWRLPFFVDRASATLRPRQARDVDAIRALAAELQGGRAVGHALAFGAMDAAMLAAPAAGPIGVGLAVLWGLVELGVDLKEYRELGRLFDATLDPSLLLLDLEHEPASALAVLLDLVGVLVP